MSLRFNKDGTSLKEVPPYILQCSHPISSDSILPFASYHSNDMRNYKQACAYMFEHLWKRDFTWKDIEEVHKILVKGTSRNDEQNGPFRTSQIAIVLKVDSTELPQFIRKVFTDEDVKIWTDFQKKMHELSKDYPNGMLEELYKRRQISEQEWAVWRKLGFIPPLPDKLPEALRVFKEQLTTKQAELHGTTPADQDMVFAVAAWIHQQLTHLHAYMYGNGRLARLFMNLVLMKHGYLPIECNPEEVYMEYCAKADSKLDEFIEFIRVQEEVILKVRTEVNPTTGEHVLKPAPEGPECVFM